MRDFTLSTAEAKRTKTKWKKISNVAGAVSEREHDTALALSAPPLWQTEAGVPPPSLLLSAFRSHKSASTRTQGDTQTVCLTHKHTDARTQTHSPVAMHSDGSIEGFEVFSPPNCLCVGGTQLLTNCLIPSSLPLPLSFPIYSTAANQRFVLGLAIGNDKQSECVSSPLFPEIRLLTSRTWDVFLSFFFFFPRWHEEKTNVGTNTWDTGGYSCYRWANIHDAQIELVEGDLKLKHLTFWEIHACLCFGGLGGSHEREKLSHARLTWTKEKVWIQMHFHPSPSSLPLSFLPALVLIAFHTFCLSL